MKRPQRPMLALAGTYERKAHEGRLIELEATGTVITQERLEARPALGFRERAPIEPLDGDLDVIEHLLCGVHDAFPAEAAAQNRMSLDDPLPRANKVSFLQRLAQRRYHLLEVDATIQSADGVEQHPRLHRRQFVGVDYSSHGIVAGLGFRPGSGSVNVTSVNGAATRIVPQLRSGRTRLLRTRNWHRCRAFACAAPVPPTLASPKRLTAERPRSRNPARESPSLPSARL